MMAGAFSTQEGNPLRKNHLEDLDIDGSIVLKFK
jgi:hypothetical protein